MPELPRVSGKDAVRAFEKLGFVECRIKGSHHMLKKPGVEHTLSIPVHGNKTVAPGLLRAEIRDSGVTIQQFIDALP